MSEKAENKMGQNFPCIQYTHMWIYTGKQKKRYKIIC